MPTHRQWLDVGCGTGAVCAAILDYCSPSSVVGIDPSDGFLNTVRENLASRADFRRGSATNIRLDDSSIDVVVSGLVLNFVADPPAAFREMARVTRPSGTIAAYVWDYAEKMELLRLFWNAAVALNPQAGSLDEGVRFPFCRPDALVELFTAAGLKGAEVTPIDILTHFENFDDCWLPFLGGQGPAPAYVMSLDETARSRLRDHFRQLVPLQRDGSISLTARVWAVRARVRK